MATVQTQNVGIANTIIDIVQQLSLLKGRIDAVAAQFTQLTSQTTLNAMATCAVNADGSLGTADGSPNAAHPIDTRVIQALNRAVLASDLGSALTGINMVSTLLAGGAPTQQGQMPSILAKFVGG